MIQKTRKSHTAFSLAICPSAQIVLAFTTLALATTLLTPAPALAQRDLDPQTVRFVADVVCGTEFGENEDNLCTRWAKAPTLSTFGSGSHHPTVMANVVRQLNECLPAQLQVTLLKPQDESASIKVYFVPLKEFSTVAGENDFEYISSNWGFFDVRWNGNFEIVRATVLIADDKLQGKRLHHFVLEEVTQCFGMAGDSNRFKDSIFYENSSKNEWGTATRLSELDKKLIRFLYGRVKPGSHPIELGIQMARYWR